MPTAFPTRKQSQAGTGFTNLQRILQANKSNQLGQTVGAGIQKAGQQATGAIQQAGQQFKTEAEKERERQSQVGEKVSNVLGGDLSNVDDEATTVFQGARSGQSKGPEGLGNVDKLAQQAQEAQGLGQATGQEQGRLGLLQRFVGQGNRYTGGQQRLDNLLLGQTGQKDLTASRRGTFGLNANLANQEIAAREQGKELKSGAQNLKETTIGKLQGSVSGYDTAMQQKAEQEKAAREEQVKNILGGDLEVEQSVYDQLKEAGLDPTRDALNTDLTQVIQANTDLANKRAIQNQQDFSKVQALSKLSGNDLGDKQGLLNEYLASEGDVGSFAASNMFKTPSQIALDEALRAKETEYGNVKTTDLENIRTPTVNLIKGAQGFNNLLSNYYTPPTDMSNLTPEQAYVENKLKNQLQSVYPTPDADLNRGQSYLSDLYGSYGSQIEQAKAEAQRYASGQVPNAGNQQIDAQLMLQRIAEREAGLKSAEDKYKQDQQLYRVGRLLRVKPNA